MIREINNETTIIGSQDDSTSPLDPSEDVPSSDVPICITADGENELELGGSLSDSDGDGDSVVQSASGGASGSVTSSEIECDIGKLQDSGVDVKNLSRDDKYRLLTTEPNSDPDSYPRTQPCPSSNFRRFKPEWLRSYPWMHYSRFSDGVYCRACVVFSPYQVGGRDLGKFVLEPFRYWTKTAHRATEHAKNRYHRSAMVMMAEFLVRYESPSQAIDAVLNSQLRQTMETNQKVVESLLRIVILCGKQGLA